MLRPLALAALAVAASGCDSGGAESQDLFNELALSSPVEGITAIDAQGTTTRTDPDDWRIGPAYQSDVRFAFLPSPNPARRSDVVSFQLVSAFSDALPGLRARVLVVDREGRAELVPLFDGTCRAGAVSCSITVRASQIDAQNAGGLYRLVVDDGRGIVTYGDVEVR